MLESNLWSHPYFLLLIFQFVHFLRLSYESRSYVAPRAETRHSDHPFLSNKYPFPFVLLSYSRTVSPLFEYNPFRPTLPFRDLSKRDSALPWPDRHWNRIKPKSRPFLVNPRPLWSQKTSFSLSTNSCSQTSFRTRDDGWVLRTGVRSASSTILFYCSSVLTKWWLITDN